MRNITFTNPPVEHELPASGVSGGRGGPFVRRLNQREHRARVIDRVAYYGVVIGGCVLLINLTIQNGFDAVGFGLFIVMYVTLTLGMTVGSHRYFSHRSFEASRGAKIAIVIMACMGMGCVLDWAAVHRRHHQFSDRDGDAHSPHKYHGRGFMTALRNFAHAHWGWLFSADDTIHERYVPDWYADETVMKYNGLMRYWVLLAFVAPALAGFILSGSGYGLLMGFLWGGCLTAFCLHNITYCINSVCHLIGRRAYRVRDHSRNNRFVALFGFGEGWHNNHHAFPSSARFGIDAFQLDPGYYFIVLLERLGLARKVNHGPDEDARRSRRIKNSPEI